MDEGEYIYEGEPKRERLMTWTELDGASLRFLVIGVFCQSPFTALRMSTRDIQALYVMRTTHRVDL
jgi:hypothetical protein